MPFPVAEKTIVTGSLGMPGYNPIHFNNSAYYCVTVDSTNRDLHVYKATSPNGPWTVQDDANRYSAPVTQVTNLQWLTTAIVNNYIVMAFSEQDTGAPTTEALLRYGPTFNTDTDSWTSQIGFTVDNNSSEPGQFTGMIVPRVLNAVFILVGPDEAIMGDSKWRVDYRTLNPASQSWGSLISVDDGGDIHYGNPIAIVGSQSTTDVHFAYARNSSTAFDPPVAWGQIVGKTLGSSTLSSQTTITSISWGIMRGMNNAVGIDTGSVYRMVLAGSPDGTQSYVTYPRSDEDGNNDLSQFVNQFDVVAPTPFRSDTVDASTTNVVVDSSGVLHFVYKDSSASDIYEVTSSDDGDTLDSTTASAIKTGITANWSTTSIINDHLFVKYEDGSGNIKYFWTGTESATSMPSIFSNGLTGAGTALSITNVNTTNDWDDGDTNIPATGTGFYTAP